MSKATRPTSAGTFSLDGFGSGTVQATWYREANSSAGTCILEFEPSGIYVWDTFTHPFELLEHTGPLSYTPSSNTVTGAVALKRTGNAANTLDGPASFVKVATNRFNQLDLQPGGWTNDAQQVLRFPATHLDRDLNYPTNYYGYVGFTDGEPNTTEADYDTWVLSIDDSNDTDHDGIPDFSDDRTAPRRPRLTLKRGDTNLWLAICGDLGYVHRVEDATHLTSPSWQPVTSVTLTNDPQLVSLPLPTAQAKFWRVVAE